MKDTIDVLEILQSQHAEVDQLFEQIEGGEGDRAALFDELADKIAAHSTVEERIFYPAAMDVKTEDLLREAVEEHLSAKRVIADILESDPSDPQFSAKVKVLQEQIEHHVKEEETELFPKVQKLFSKDELEDLAVVMQDTAEDLEKGAPRESIPAETGAPSSID